MTTELYGCRKGSTEEVLLLTNATPERVEKCKALAAPVGFHSFRVVTCGMDFDSMVNTFMGKQ